METTDRYDRAAVESVLAESSDPDNPGPEEVHAWVRETLRIAVVGMSRDPSKAARRVPSYLAAKGAEIIPVNPYAERILGKDARDTLAEVTEPVDMVLVFRPSAEAGAVLRDAAARPEDPVIWLQEGIRDDEAAREARAAGHRVVQDLCMYKVHRALGDTLRRAQEKGTA
ncbi:MAG: CoA-binding protein [Gemmatimonadota bacterium]